MTIFSDNYEAVIGIEIHVQLKTKSKIFCSCPNQFGVPPNKNLCETCMGLPGTLPLLNKKAVEYALMMGAATNCTVSKMSDFARKHYLYPDLPKNYQITQGDRPICYGGHVNIENENGGCKKIRLIRIHLEEDAGKNIHSPSGEGLVDLNRAGTPLIEIVSEPDISSSQEAKLYLKRIRSVVRYLGISDADMEKGSFRADVNISVKLKSEKKLGTKVELKNINSFKFIGQAIDHEIERQIELVESGDVVHQETRLWDTKNQETIFMRSKEESQDYRYFTEPDLPMVIVDDEWLSCIKESLPELPHDKFVRFREQYNLTGYEADILTANQELADFFEKANERCNDPKQVSNWILRDFLEYLKSKKIEISDSKISPEMLGELIEEVSNGTINSKTAKDVFAEMSETGEYPSIIIEKNNLKQIGSEDELEKVVLEVIESNKKVAEDFLAGNERVFGFLVGTCMKKTAGKGNPQVIQKLIRKHLS